MRKMLNSFLAILMLFTAIPINVLAVGLDATDEWTNVALNKSVTVSGSEAEIFNGSKLVDGVVDRTGDIGSAGKSRWASDLGVGKKWVEIDLEAEYEINEIALEWERRNATDYTLSVSTDGEDYQVIEDANTTPETFREEFSFEPLQARYVRLEINDFDESSEGITWATVSLYEIEVFGKAEGQTPEPTEPQNLALNRPASSSDNEVPRFSEDKAFDGIVDRDGGKQSRWASNTIDGVKWLQVDLGSIQELKTFIVEWERRNAADYEILISDDGEEFTSVYHNTNYPALHRDRIVLDESVEGRYVKLQINELHAQIEGNWNNVSVFEFEMYSEEIAASNEEIVKTIQMPEQKLGDDYLILPESEDYTVTLLGTDNLHIVDEEGRITHPLIDKVIAVDLEVTIDEEVYELLDRKVMIPGMNNEEDSINQKPTVVPELSEWFGYEGEIKIDESSRIVVDAELGEAFIEGIEEFILDFNDLFGYELELVVGDNPTENDFYFTHTNENNLREEGYYIQIDDAVRISANHATGMYWATRTLLHMLVTNDSALNKGEIRDYPKWETRGFMLDVGRKTISMDFLNELSREMSWYKMNDFHVHLNDNYIFLEDYTARGLDPFDAYAGFRLESSIEGLTSEDVYYTKEEFAEFISNSAKRGVQIVPEIDVPAHSLALTQARPDLAMGTVGREADHLDLENPESLTFVKEIFNEYLEGEDPLFTKDTVVHVGTDEYDSAYPEEFRQFTDDMLAFVQDHDRTVRLWGGLTARPGNTPVRSEGVQMNIWSFDWSHPQQMYDAGYDLINTLDSDLYIVPDAGYYYDYLNIQHLYNNWEANTMRHVTIPASSPQMLGGAFALWNDQIDLRNNGIAEIDIYDRINHALPTMASKLWGIDGDVNFTDFQETVKKVGEAPRTNLRHEVERVNENTIVYDFEQSETQDFSGNDYDIVAQENVEFQEELQLKGGTSYLTTSLTDVALGNTLQFRAKQDANASADSEQVLFEHGTTQIKASQNKTGKLGFTREGLDYSFDYELPKDEWVDLAIATEKQKITLYVNGEFVEEIKRVRQNGFYPSMNASLLLPIERIGSEDDAFEGAISRVRIVEGKEPNYDFEHEVDPDPETEEEAKRAAVLVDRMIYRLPNVRVLTADDTELVESVRTAYDNLSDQAKTHVKYLSNLELREDRLDILNAEEEVADEFAVRELQRRIYRLPSARNITLDDAPQVDAIREDYDALNDASKDIFSPQYLKNLELREDRLAELENIESNNH